MSKTAAASILSPPSNDTLPEWDLTDLYAGMESPQLQADKKKLREDAKAFAAQWKGKLADMAQGAPDTLAQALATYEQIQDVAGRLSSYADLLYAGNTLEATRAKFYGDMQQYLTDVASDLLFFELELNRIDDGALAKALSQSPALAHYAPWLKDLRREKPHQLDDRTEQLFLEKSISGRTGWNRLFDETLADLRFRIDDKELTLEPTLNLLQDPKEETRRGAAEALAATFKTELRGFTLITNTLAKDKEISDRWHNFTDMADSRHLANRVEREVVEALVAAVQSATPRLSHRYYALKAKWLGKAQLDHWDRNAPLPGVKLKTYNWSEARELVLAAFGRFAPDMAEIAKNFFTKNWIDAPSRPGKAPGAFSHPTTPSAHPYILLNYLGKPRDVMTLAHELGHGVHQVLAAPQGALMAPTPLTLAETASVFGEMLTFRRLLDDVTDKAQRKAMLAAKVEDMLNTVVRQIAFYSFERKVHAARQKGELTAEDIGNLWLDVQRESLGAAINLGPGYETFWVYIGHFIHTPFYVYAYAFGDCLVNSLYALYEKGSPHFVENYFALLRAGGSKPYAELLAPFGLDARHKDFWQLGLSLLDQFITQLEEM